MALVHPVSKQHTPVPVTSMSAISEPSHSSFSTLFCWPRSVSLVKQMHSTVKLFSPIRNYLVEGKYLQGRFEIHAFKYVEAAYGMEDGDTGAGLSTAGRCHPLGDLTHFASKTSRLHQLSSASTCITFLTSYIFVIIIIIFLRWIKINQVDHMWRMEKE